MIAIRGYGSRLAQEFIKHLPPWEQAVPVERGANNTTADRHLFCQGVLFPKVVGQLEPEELYDSAMANFVQVVKQCDLIFAVNDRARVCVIGSESGFSWSFDGAYAGFKAAVHRYVETKRLRTRDQQLVCVAPSIVEGLGMTTRRTDIANLERRRMTHPKGRFLTVNELCKIVHFVLYEDEGYLTNTVIRVNGGAHTA